MTFVPSLLQITDVKVGQDSLGPPSMGIFVKEVIVTASRGDGIEFPIKSWTGEEDKVTVKDAQGTEAEVPLGKSYFCSIN